MAEDAIDGQTALAALKDAGEMLDTLNLGFGGQRHRTIERGLDCARWYIEGMEGRMGRLLEAETLRDGIAIQGALDRARLAGEIRQVAARDAEQPARYRVETADLGTFEGSVEQVVAILGRMVGGGA